MIEKPSGLVVPHYEQLGIPGPYFGDKVWEHLDYLQAMNIHGPKFENIPVVVNPFPDNAEKTLLQQNVRERDVYVMHSLYTVPGRHVMIGAEIFDDLVRSDANRIYNFEPYNPYFRQDARQDRE